MLFFYRESEVPRSKMRYISCEKHNFGVDTWIRIMFWGKAKEQKVTTIRPKNKLFF